MVSVADPTDMKELAVTAVSEADKSVSVFYPGTASGEWGFKISGKDKRSINCAPPPGDCYITSILEVTDFSPRQGSTLGGTLVTITG